MTHVHPDQTAFRAVDACNRTYTPEQEASGYAQGHRDAIEDALKAVKPVDAMVAELITALTHIAGLEAITDAATGHADDAAQASARAAIAKATSA